MSLGRQLRTAREQKGYSIDDIASKTFIRAHHLDAIERDDFADLPPSRIRYFVRDYARAVGLDPESLLAELPAIEVKAPEPTPLPSTTRGRLPSLPKREKGKRAKRTDKAKASPPLPVPAESESTPAIVEPDVAAPAPARESSRKNPRYRPIDQGNPMLARIVIGIALLLLIALGVWYLFGRSGEPTDEMLSAGIDTTVNAPTRIIGEADDAITDTTGSDSTIVIADIGDSLLLEGRFTERVWYSVGMDGAREDAATVDSGEVRQWRASETFSISLGNAGGVSFHLNGKDLGTLGPSGGTVRGRIVDRDGLRGAGTQTTANSTRRRSRPRRARSTRPRQRNTEESAPRRPSSEPTEPRDGI